LSIIKIRIEITRLKIKEASREMKAAMWITPDRVGSLRIGLLAREKLM